MSITLKSIAAMAACFVFSSCWAPEHFTATLHVDKNRNFKFTYDGTIAFGPALGEIKQRGHLSPQEEAEIKKGGAELYKEPGFKSVEYAGMVVSKSILSRQGRFRMGKQYSLVSSSSVWKRPAKSGSLGRRFRPRQDKSYPRSISSLTAG